MMKLPPDLMRIVITYFSISDLVSVSKALPELKDDIKARDPRIFDKMKAGKHKGKYVHKVAIEWPDYLIYQYEQRGTNWINVINIAMNSIDVARIRMPIGKYKGTAINQIPRSYLRWFFMNVTNQGPCIRKAVMEVMADMKPKSRKRKALPLTGPDSEQLYAGSELCKICDRYESYLSEGVYGCFNCIGICKTCGQREEYDSDDDTVEHSCHMNQLTDDIVGAINESPDITAAK